jgi:hypothetical protein
MRTLAVSALLALTVAGCKDSTPGPVTPSAVPSAAALTGASDVIPSAPRPGGPGRPFVIELTGAAERPGPGDPDGTGVARFAMNLGTRQICWRLQWSNIDTPTAAHIHVAPVTAPGPVVVPLSPIASGCATNVSKDLMHAIFRNPGSYYVNIHNAAFPAGAIRGQLSRQTVGRR